MTDVDDIKHIREKLDQVHMILTGNGNPSSGLVVRVDRMEQSTAAAKWFLGVVIVALIGLFIGQIQIKQISSTTRQEVTHDGR